MFLLRLARRQEFTINHTSYWNNNEQYELFNIVIGCLFGESLGGGAFSESVLELSGDSLEVTHTASAGGSPSLSLLAPLVRSGLSVGVSARRASLLLLVERHLAASSASSVGLRVSLTKTLGTLGHFLLDRPNRILRRSRLGRALLQQPATNATQWNNCTYKTAVFHSNAFIKYFKVTNREFILC